MRPIAAAVFFTLLLSAPLVAVGYYLGNTARHHTTEWQMVIGPRGERGLPGVNGTDGKPGQDCDCAALKAEAVEYVRKFETRLSGQQDEINSLEARLAHWQSKVDDLEKSKCKCKCR